MPAAARERVLLVEDTPSLATLYEALISRAGHPVTHASTAAEAVALHAAGGLHLIVLDLALPDADGITVLRRIRAADSRARVIVVTVDGTISRAVEATRLGAFDFIVKPFDGRRLLSALDAAEAGLPGAAEAPPSGADTPPAPGGAAVSESDAKRGLAGFIGGSPAMRQIYDTVLLVARSTATVFISGESGTGKEVCAEAIHSLSPRRSGPFVAVNCGAIPRDLLESELFGHLRGSFTGAVADRRGAAAEADGGTLFLDEICEMDLVLQTKLLRFIQTSMIQPVGASQPQRVDVRIVCATNRDPAAEVRSGRFRKDLYYRLHVVPIHLPPLRARGNDVLDIAETLLARYAAEEGRDLTHLSSGVRQRFRAYGWPGNVRELQNVLRTAVVLHDGEELTLEMLGEAFGAAPSPPRVVEANSGAISGAMAGDPWPEQAPPGDAERESAARALVGLSLDEIERRVIASTVAACDGSIPRAAGLLGVSPSTLYRKRGQWKEQGRSD